MGHSQFQTQREEMEIMKLYVSIVTALGGVSEGWFIANDEDNKEE